MSLDDTKTESGETPSHESVGGGVNRRDALKVFAGAVSLPILEGFVHVDAAAQWRHSDLVFTARIDGRDAFMSFVNHVQRMKMIDMLNAQAAQEGLPLMKKFDGDYHAYFKIWLAELDYFDVVASYWARRNEANLLFVHFNDMKADLGAEIAREHRRVSARFQP